MSAFKYHRDLAGTCRIFCPNTEEYTFYLAPNGASLKWTILWYKKTHLNTFRITEITPLLGLTHNAAILEFNTYGIPSIYSHLWRLPNSLLNDE